MKFLVVLRHGAHGRAEAQASAFFVKALRRSAEKGKKARSLSGLFAPLKRFEFFKTQQRREKTAALIGFVLTARIFTTNCCVTCRLKIGPCKFPLLLTLALL